MIVVCCLVCVVVFVFVCLCLLLLLCCLCLCCVVMCVVVVVVVWPSLQLCGSLFATWGCITIAVGSCEALGACEGPAWGLDHSLGAELLLHSISAL